jgi:hypothetical protein
MPPFGGGLIQLFAYGEEDLGPNKFIWLSREGKYNNFTIIDIETNVSEYISRLVWEPSKLKNIYNNFTITKIKTNM